MSDAEILDYIERCIRPLDEGVPATASVKLSSKIDHGFIFYRFGGGSWWSSLRSAIEDYARRHPR